MTDGLDWLLNCTGLDPATIAHFWHLEDDEYVAACRWCNEGGV